MAFVVGGGIMFNTLNYKRFFIDSLLNPDRCRYYLWYIDSTGSTVLALILGRGNRYNPYD